MRAETRGGDFCRNTHYDQQTEKKKKQSALSSAGCVFRPVKHSNRGVDPFLLPVSILAVFVSLPGPSVHSSSTVCCVSPSLAVC